LKTAGSVVARHQQYYKVALQLKKQFGLDEELGDDCTWEYIEPKL
jgi:acyl-CoA dehydrogenase